MRLLPLVCGLLAFALLAPARAQEARIEAPFSKRQISLAFAKELNEVDLAGGVVKLQEKGVRILTREIDMNLNVAAGQTLSPAECNALGSKLKNYPTKMEAVFLPNGWLLGRSHGEDLKLSQDTIILVKHHGPWRKNLLSHEWLHLELMNYGAFSIGDSKIMKSLDAQARTHQAFYEYRRLNPKGLTFTNLKEKTVTENAAGYEALAMMNYYLAQEGVSTLIDEIDVHLTLHKQGLSPEGNQELDSVAIHIDARLDQLQRMMSQFEALLKFKSQITAETKIYIEAAQELEKLVFSFIEPATLLIESMATDGEFTKWRQHPATKEMVEHSLRLRK